MWTDFSTWDCFGYGCVHGLDFVRTFLYLTLLVCVQVHDIACLRFQSNCNRLKNFGVSKCSSGTLGRHCNNQTGSSVKSVQPCLHCSCFFLTLPALGGVVEAEIKLP